MHVDVGTGEQEDGTFPTAGAYEQTPPPPTARHAELLASAVTAAQAYETAFKQFVSSLDRVALQIPVHGPVHVAG